jgi:hypothetical protein
MKTSTFRKNKDHATSPALLIIDEVIYIREYVAGIYKLNLVVFCRGPVHFRYQMCWFSPV